MSFLNGTDPGLRQTKVPVVDTYAAGSGFTAGSTTALTLSADPGNENACEVSFDGILQHGSTFTHSGTTLTFSSAIPTGVTEVQVRHAAAIPATTPADSSVSVGKLSTTGTPSATTFLRGDMAWAAAGGGLVLQMIYSEIAKTSTTDASMGDDDSTPLVTEGVELDSQAITLADDSNKCLISGCINYGQDTGDVGALFALFRGSTCIWAAATDITGATYKADCISFQYLDSPASASEITYSLRYAVAGGGTVRINFGTPADDQATLKTSSLLFTEISA